MIESHMQKIRKFEAPKINKTDVEADNFRIFFPDGLQSF